MYFTFNFRHFEHGNPKEIFTSNTYGLLAFQRLANSMANSNGPLVHPFIIGCVVTGVW